jgi:hypothetical protein
VEKKDEPTVGLDMMGEPIIDPAPDKPPTWEDSPAGKALFKGGAWGALAGMAIAIYYYSSTDYWPHSPLGFFDGDLLFVAPALGYVLGALLGWLSVKVTGKDEVPTPPSYWNDPSGTGKGPL